MKSIELRSEYPCLVKWAKNEEFLDEASCLTFLNPEILYIYPATGKKDNIAFVLDLSQINKNFCQQFNLEDRQLCLLTENPPLITIKDEITLNERKIQLALSTEEAKFETDERIVTVQTIQPKTYELSSYKDFVVLKIKGLSEEQIILLNINTYDIFNEIGSIIEFSNGELSCQKYGKEEKFSIVDDRIIRAKTIEPQTKNSKIVALKFLEKIKNREYKSALSLMWENLSPSEEKLKAYFGEIKKILPLSQEKFLIVKKSGYYVVKLEMLDNKISNIEILD